MPLCFEGESSPVVESLSMLDEEEAEHPSSNIRQMDFRDIPEERVRELDEDSFPPQMSPNLFPLEPSPQPSPLVGAIQSPGFSSSLDPAQSQSTQHVFAHLSLQG